MTSSEKYHVLSWVRTRDLPTREGAIATRLFCHSPGKDYLSHIRFDTDWRNNSVIWRGRDPEFNRKAVADTEQSQSTDGDDSKSMVLGLESFNQFIADDDDMIVDVVII